MSSVQDDCANYANVNPDISGVGVRIGLYLQTFSLVLLVDRSWQGAPIALWTFIATSFGLTVAAIVQREHLTLFQALQVSNLVWLANFGTFVALASYSRQKAASHIESGGRSFDYNVKFGAMAQTLLSMALTLYMWTNARTFGSQPDCSVFVKYMVFVIKVPALGAGRTLGIAVTSILTTAYCTITLWELRSYCRRDTEHGKQILPTHSSSTNSSRLARSTYHPPSSQSPSAPTVTLQDPHYHTGYQRQSAVLPGLDLPHPPKFHKRRHKRRRWSFDLDPMLVGVIICQAMVFTYFIVSSELLLKNNPSLDHSAAQWSFGQILALIVVIPSALSLIEAIMQHGVRHVSKHNIRKRR